MSAISESLPRGAGAWPSAARLVARWLDRRERVDALLDTLPKQLPPIERARCQHLVLGVVRHFGRIDAALAGLVAHPPRFATRAVLFLAGFELIEAAGKPDFAGRTAKIVHHAVEQTKALASPAEARLVNAVVRKLAPTLDRPPPAANAAPDELAAYYSHPAWLVRTWAAQFGAEATRALLEWNQQPATVYARWRNFGDIHNPPADSPAADTPPIAVSSPPEFLKPTRWPQFFEVESGHWPEIEPLLKSGAIYLQDPATRLAVELLAPQPGETLLDLCAAPGGKSLLIADAVAQPQGNRTGPSAPAANAEEKANPSRTSEERPGQETPPHQKSLLVAVDLPGERIERLKENLARTVGIDVALVQGDMLTQPGALLREHGLPETYDGVLLDVPCSNTGVMRHRVDVKWRLQPGDFKKHPQQQLSMLHHAARLVAPGGRLVYSTCSIDAEENEHVVRAFLASKAGGTFKLADSVSSFPWTSGHDGAGAFLLRRAG